LQKFIPLRLSRSLILAIAAFSISPAYGRDVRIIGDSIFALTGVITREFRARAPFRVVDHSVNGETIAGIRSQYRRIRNAPITTIIMDGGGNDVLGASGDCKSLNLRCRRIIERSVEVMSQTLDEMYDNDVENVVFLGYYHPIGLQAGLRRAIDYATPLMMETCAAASVNCYFVDPRTYFDCNGGLIMIDGIHPSGSGSGVLAYMLWKTFVDNDIEEAANSSQATMTLNF
jgi:hypothetical protein